VTHIGRLTRPCSSHAYFGPSFAPIGRPLSQTKVVLMGITFSNLLITGYSDDEQTLLLYFPVTIKKEGDPHCSVLVPHPKNRTHSIHRSIQRNSVPSGFPFHTIVTSSYDVTQGRQLQTIRTGYPIDLSQRYSCFDSMKDAVTAFH